MEFAPGLGKTAEQIIENNIASYTGIDSDEAAVTRITGITAPVNGKVRQAQAQETGLEDNSADVVIGEAMLTMQGEKNKEAIIAEARRILRPGGRYAIHELALVPDDIDPEYADGLRRKLAQVIRVNARPLTVKEWTNLLEQAGFEVEEVNTAPKLLLSTRRNIADEGVLGVLKILRNVLRDKDLRARVLEMRQTFNEYKQYLAGIGIIARLPN